MPGDASGQALVDMLLDMEWDNRQALRASFMMAVRPRSVMVSGRDCTGAGLPCQRQRVRTIAFRSFRAVLSPVAAATSRAISTDSTTWSARYTFPCHKNHFSRSDSRTTASRRTYVSSSSWTVNGRLLALCGITVKRIVR